MAILAAIIVVFSLVLPVAGIISVQQRAAGAADASALAAADVAVGIRAGSPCAVAATVASANRTRLDGCVVEGTTVTVRVAALVLGLTVAASATAGRPSEK